MTGKWRKKVEVMKTQVSAKKGGISFIQMYIFIFLFSCFIAGCSTKVLTITLHHYMCFDCFWDWCPKSRMVIHLALDDFGLKLVCKIMLQVHCRFRSNSETMWPRFNTYQNFRTFEWFRFVRINAAQNVCDSHSTATLQSQELLQTITSNVIQSLRQQMLVGVAIAQCDRGLMLRTFTFKDHRFMERKSFYKILLWGKLDKIEYFVGYDFLRFAS